MTREEEWEDPEIQRLLLDLRDSIRKYRHENSRSPAPMSTACGECGKRTPKVGRQLERTCPSRGLETTTDYPKQEEPAA